MNLHKMNLLERDRAVNCDMSVVRVPGGWIFIDYGAGETASQSQCFVPYSTEFKINSEQGESCQQPITGNKREPTAICPECGGDVGNGMGPCESCGSGVC